MTLRKRSGRVTTGIAMLLMSILAWAGNPAEQPVAGYDALLATAHASGDLSAAEQVRAVEASYWELFPAGELKGRSVAELDELLRATLAGASYTHLPKIADRSLEVLDALEVRHAADKQHYAIAFQALLAASELDAADKLARQHPDAGLPRLPERRTDASFAISAPAEWVLSPGAGELTRRRATVDAPFQILVVAHPLCHFSQSAVAAISHDPALAEVFSKYGHWITPPLRESDVPVIAAWNREHPGFSMTSVYDPNRWPGFDFRETPVFFLLVDGNIRQTIAGWPGDEQASRLKQAIAQLLNAPGAQAQDSARTIRR